LVVPLVPDFSTNSREEEESEGREESASEPSGDEQQAASKKSSRKKGKHDDEPQQKKKAKAGKKIEGEEVEEQDGSLFGAFPFEGVGLSSKACSFSQTRRDGEESHCHGGHRHRMDCEISRGCHRSDARTSKFHSEGLHAPPP